MAKLAETYVSAPSTERGQGILVAGHAASDSIVYCNGRSVVIRSLSDPLQLDIYGEHSYPVTVARFSPNGEWIASGDVSGNVRIWAKGPGHVLKLEIRPLSGRIDDLDWSFDGERIVVCGEGKGSYVKAFMWDSGAPVGEFDGHSKRVLSCSFKPTRPFRIVTCGEDFLVNFYDGPPFRFKKSHREHSNFVNCVRFSPDGTKCISVSSDKRGIIYNGQTGDKMGELSGAQGHTASIYAVSWSPDSDKVLTVSGDRTAKIWNISPGGSCTLLSSFTFEDDAKGMQVGCLWLGSTLLSISLAGIITFLPADGHYIPGNILSGHIKSITALVPSGNGEYLTSSYDGIIVRWKLGKGFVGRLSWKLEVHPATLIVVAGRGLWIGGYDNHLRRFALDGHEYSEEDSLDIGAQPKDIQVASREGHTVLVTVEHELILLRGATVASRIGVGFGATCGSLSPDGSEAAVGGQDGKIYLYHVQGNSMQQYAILEKHRGAITAVRFSPNGVFVASGDQNREAVVWDHELKKVKLKNMLYHTARVTAIAWAPDSNRVATGSVDTNVFVYEVNKPASARISIKSAHLGGVAGLAFEDPRTVLSGGGDSCVRVWSLPAPSEVHPRDVTP